MAVFYSYSKPIAANGGTTRSVSAAGRVTENVSDAAGQTVLARIAPGTASATITTQSHDLLGRVIASVADAGGLNQTSQYTYDVHGRSTSSKDALNRTTTHTYANSVSGDAVAAATRSRVITTLPDTRSSVSRMDALGRMIATTDPKNQTQRHTYWYETGQQLTLTDARNNTTNWTYNLRGQLLTKTYPNGDDHVYTYDALGRMATHTTPNNHVCTYSYDLRDRQTLANWNTSTPDTTKEYFTNGLLKSIDNGVSKSDYAYNVRNQLTSETQALAGRAAKIVSYSYDADGLRTDLGYPSSPAVTYEWTDRGQLQTVSADGPPPLATYTYDKLGRNTSLVHENGITQAKSYDAASQFLANTHLKNGSPISGHGYTLDATGRRTSETFADGSTAARTYGYDTADQVTAADYGGGQTDAYAYDPMGNRTSATIASQGGVTATYNANNANQYTSITGLTPISHDANGNLLQQNDVLYTWDSENRLLSTAPAMPALGDKSLVQSYDGSHRRVTRTTREWTAGGWNDTETTHFIYDGWNVIEEYYLSPLSSTLARTRTWGQDLGGSSSLQAAGGVGGLIMVEEINGSTTTAYHFHYDGNGNVTEITDNTGSPAASYRYDAFGNTLVATGTYATQNRYRFSTKPLDNEVTDAPLYYYGYRYYDPATGRWPSRDPIEERGGVNLYGFVGNDGVDKWDFLGMKNYTCCFSCCENKKSFYSAVFIGSQTDGTKAGEACSKVEKPKNCTKLAFVVGTDDAVTADCDKPAGF